MHPNYMGMIKMARGLSLKEVEAIRETPGKSALLFLTDRCPVECSHCSVSSLRNGRSIEDYQLFNSLLEDICSRESLQMVGISGGEPFSERKGLILAVDRFRRAGLDVVLYTSGYWAGKKSTPKWVQEILQKVGTVFLSPDAYHSDRLGAETLISAIRAVSESGVALVLQLVSDPRRNGDNQRVLDLVEELSPRPEVNFVPLLSYGRSHISSRHGKAAKDLPPCRATASPVIRYDARVIACCNEGIIMGNGPRRLNTPFVPGAGELEAVLNSYRDDAWIGAISSVGPAGIDLHPAFSSDRAVLYRDTCDYCWKMQSEAQGNPEQLLHRDRILLSLSAIYGRSSNVGRPNV